MNAGLIGVIGGMGPLATADFFRKVVECIVPAIAHVKAGHLGAACAPMRQAVRSLLEGDAERVLLACTEAPIALAGASPCSGSRAQPGDEAAGRSVDTTLALARATVRHWQAVQGVA